MIFGFYIFCTSKTQLMKLSKMHLTFLIIGITFSFATFAQSKSEKQVAAAVEQLKLAMIEPTADALDKLIDDNLSYGHSGGKVEDKKSLLDALLTNKSDFVSIELTGQTISIHNKTGIVRHVLSANTNDNNKPATVKLSVLTVWQKHGSQWKMIARQAVKI